MPKLEINNLKRISTIASRYKGKNKIGVTPQYMRRFLEINNVEIVIIDGINFVDETTLPAEIVKNLKK